MDGSVRSPAGKLALASSRRDKEACNKVSARKLAMVPWRGSSQQELDWTDVPRAQQGSSQQRVGDELDWTDVPRAQQGSSQQRVGDVTDSTRKLAIEDRSCELTNTGNHLLDSQHQRFPSGLKGFPSAIGCENSFRVEAKKAVDVNSQLQQNTLQDHRDGKTYNGRGKLTRADWRQMDIEYIFWQMLHLCRSPKGVVLRALVAVRWSMVVMDRALLEVKEHVSELDLLVGL
ncbi:hypothetical protein KSP40_PGU012767 [Platanthera guangdongensis]|uniref:Uncharacterized protein n=1 Tax=Platanthera guangdongensis TaxID=2320717 RepID=A0ABR2MMW8_9ASPA